MEIKDVLKRFRKANNLTQKELAELLQVPFRTYQNWELGYNKPNKLTEKYIRTFIYRCRMEKRKEGVIEWQRH